MSHSTLRAYQFTVATLSACCLMILAQVHGELSVCPSLKDKVVISRVEYERLTSTELFTPEERWRLARYVAREIAP